MKHSANDVPNGMAQQGRHATHGRTVDASAPAPKDGTSMPAPEGGAPTPETTQEMGQAYALVKSASTRPAGKRAGSGLGMLGGRIRLRNGHKAALIAASVAVVVLVAVYVAGAVYYMGHFYPNTSIGTRDISFYSLEEVEQMLAEEAEGYELEVSGFGFSLTLTSADIGLDVDSEEIARSMLDSTSPWAWPVEVFRSRDLGESLVSMFDETGLNDLVRQAVEAHNETAQPSENATIVYSEAEQRVVVRSEFLGTQLSSDAVVACVDEAVTELATTLRLTDAELIRPEITSDDERLQAAADAATTMVAANMGFLMNGVEVARLDAATLAQWITLDENFSASLDDGQLTAWVSEVAAQCNTVGTERTYTRPDGKVVTVSGGVYGWTVDEESLIQTVRDGIASGSQETVDIPCTQTAAVFNGIGSADWGTRYLDIDLTEQYVRFYDSGEIIWESACISGIPGTYDTSTGVFVLNGKQSPSTLVGYENGEKIYETDVTYWMPFDRNVIGLHDASWQPSFGGTMYRDGYGSHGCVNLPYSAAESLYSIIQIGDVVISHY